MSNLAQPLHEPWRVLLIDGDAALYQTIESAVGGRNVAGRPVALLHADNAAQARMLIRAVPNLALILLDMGVESGNADQALLEFIRQDAALSRTRIVLCTDEPGHPSAPEAVLPYDIDDYQSKAALTQVRVLMLLTTALRAYQQLSALEANKQGLSLIARNSGTLMQARSLPDFADCVLTQLAALIGTPPDGVACTRNRRGAGPYKVLAATGHFAEHLQTPLTQWPQPHLHGRIAAALRGCSSVFGADHVVLYFGQPHGTDMAAYLDLTGVTRPVDRELLDLFCSHLATCLHHRGLMDQLHAQAYSDTLLHLPNRARLIAEIETRNVRNVRDLTLCLVDVDDFSSVNELMGHRYGDQMLLSLALRILQVVGTDVMLARVSGNAFGLLGSKRQLSPEVIRAVTSSPLLIEERPHRITVTCGYAELGDTRRSGDDYLKNAAIALKQAKKQARGQHVVYTAGIGVEARRRAQLLADLHQAFDNQHLFLMYQPQIDLATGTLTGLEALMRWRKADGTLVPPDQFIPVSEQSGLIVALGVWALQIACKDMQALMGQGLAPLRMAVNVSLEQFKSPDFFDNVMQALAHAKVPPDRLELEITESVAILGSSTVTAQLNRLRAQGIAISIDDFGTGYSSLGYLEQLPLDRMKIDKAFVRQLDESGSPRIAEMIAELGATLGLRVLAEGIETRASWDALQSIGCHEGQGFFISRPLEMQQLIPWIAQHGKHPPGH